MDKFVVRRARSPKPERIREISPPKTKQVTIESLPHVVVVEDIHRLKVCLESDLSSNEDLLSSLQELATKTPSKAVLLSTHIGKTINTLRKHSDAEISKLAKNIFRKWKHYIVEEEKDKPAIEVRCDRKTEDLRAKARTLLANALQVSDSSQVPQQIEQAVFFKFGRRIDNHYRRKMRTMIFTLRHRDNVKFNILAGKMKITELIDYQTKVS